MSYDRLVCIIKYHDVANQVDITNGVHRSQANGRGEETAAAESQPAREVDWVIKDASKQLKASLLLLLV